MVGAGSAADDAGVQVRERRKGRWRGRRLAIAGGVVVLILAGAGGAIAAMRSSTPTTSYRLVAAGTGTVRQTASASGSIQPAGIANLTFAVAGQVSSIDVTVGQSVKVGQALASVNATSLSTQVAQANATVAGDQAKLTADTNAGASSAQLTADQAALSAAQTAYTDAQNNQSQATLTAPIAGTVAALNLAVGQQVGGGGTVGATGGSGAGAGTSSSSGGSAGSGSSSSGSSSSGSSVSSSSSSSAQVVVLDTSGYQVSASVDDTEVGQIKAGDQALIVPDGSTTPVYGTVGSVGLVATSTSGVATYPVTIDVTGHPGGLFPGASAQVSIVVRQLSDVLTVPAAAVHTSGTGSVVDELQGGRQVAHPVVIGLTSGGTTQVISGLTAGTQVVVPMTARSSSRSGGGTGGGAGRGGGFGGGGGGFGGGGGGGRGGFGGGAG